MFPFRIWSRFLPSYLTPYFPQIFPYARIRWYGTWTGSFGRCLFLGSLEYTIIPANGRWWWRDGSRGGGFGFCWGLTSWVVWGGIQGDCMIVVARWASKVCLVGGVYKGWCSNFCLDSRLFDLGTRENNQMTQDGWLRNWMLGALYG